jgi:abhydrolase domain-containing protein 13
MLSKCCSDLIYPRNVPENARTVVPKPPDFQIDDYEELSLRTPDEENLHAFLIRPSNKRRFENVTIVMFHGNAGNIGHRLPIAKVLAEDLGYNVFFVEYRGYGFSSGDPNEKGLNIDAQTTLDYIRGRDDLRNSKIVIYGQSLGGAVAVSLVNRNQTEGDIAALILENTFLSIRSLIPRFVLDNLESATTVLIQLASYPLQNIWQCYATRYGPATTSCPRSETPQYSF